MPLDIEDNPQSIHPARDRLWMREPPTFVALPRVARLSVPLAREMPLEPIATKPTETPVAHGERLTTAAPELHAATLSPIASRIVGVQEVALLNGNRAPAVVLEPDVSETTARLDSGASPGAPAHAEQERVRQLIGATKPAELAVWIDRLRAAGIWADRRTSPDLLGQLHVAMRRPVDTVICSLLDADPSVCLNMALGAHFPWQIAAGVALVAAAVGAKHVMILTDLDAPSSWTQALRRMRPVWHVQVIAVRNDYPQPDPTLLMYTMLRRRLRPGRLPVEQGAIQLDGAAAVAIGRLLFEEAPMLSVPLVLRDRIHSATHFLDVPIGTALEGVLSALGMTSDRVEFRSGELLRQQRVPAASVVAGGELVVDVALPHPGANPEPCIRCGWCIEMCPTRVQPAGVLEAAQRADVALGQHYGIEACIECGICSYVCPSRLPLLEGIRNLKKASAIL